MQKEMYRTKALARHFARAKRDPPTLAQIWVNYKTPLKMDEGTIN